MKYKYLFFDFDGVIAESLEVKANAFRKMYEPFGKDIAEKVLHHHINNGGISRFEKFKIYHEEYVGIAVDNQKINELANTFSTFVLDGVVNSPYVNGFMEFMEKIGSGTTNWIITGTPTNEIIEILKRRSIKNLFTEAFGSPQKKDYWTEHIIDTHNLSRESILFLGDALSDFNAARSSGIDFALRTHKDNVNLLEEFNGIRFADFYELESLLS
ncbi:MAG: HAD hydrolase-like protein [Bacteroidota bacterium]